MLALWDTDILSEYSKGRNALILQKANLQLIQHGQFLFSIISRYEVLRGLRAKRATSRISKFEAFCRHHTILPLSDEILDLAADLWADLKRKGQLIEDADLFIAATALHHGLPLATGNVAHFARVPGLTLEDWTQP